MRTRQEIKEHAKQMFSQQRWSCIGAVFLVMMIYGIYYSFSFTSSFSSTLAIFLPTNILVIGAFAGMILSLISLAAMILYSVLAVNLSGTMVKAYYGQPIQATEPYSALSVNFGRKLGGIMWVSLWLMLWSLIPFAGIVFFFVKSAEYFMAEYILANHPNVKATEALDLSKRMTYGHKGKIFVMGLSFFGWQMLNVLTFGILGIFYVNPYMYMSLAGMFIEVRNEAIARGTIHPSELDGVAAYYPQYGQYPQQQYGQPQHTQQPPQQQYGQPQHTQQPQQQYGQPQYTPQPPQQYGQTTEQNTQPLQSGQPTQENQDQNPPQPPIQL